MTTLMIETGTEMFNELAQVEFGTLHYNTGSPFKTLVETEEETEATDVEFEV